MIDSKTSSPRNGNPLYRVYGSRRTLRWLLFLVAAALTTLYMTGQKYAPGAIDPKATARTSTAMSGILHNHVPHRHSSKQKAKLLLPAELIQRPISHDLQTMPKLLHQSWSDTDLPAKMERWSATCRRQHPDWEWVLWTDDDNEELVKTYFPWLLKTYRELPGVIYKADMVRNLYLYMFGGVYADLDVECLRPFDELFKEYNVTTVSHAKPRPVSAHTMQKNGRKIFYGRMGVDKNSGNSIPNAWMAATPGHPFNLLVVESTMKGLADASSKTDQSMPGPEALTGPERLFSMIQEYQNPKGPWVGEKLDEHVAKVPAAKHFTPERGLEHSMEILPFYKIFPYSWERDGEAYRDVCWVAEASFNAERCKALLGTDYWPSYAITYWSHTWAGDGHDEGNVNKLQHKHDANM